MSLTTYKLSAQAIGDYRSTAGGVANFNNRGSWERWNGSNWVTNSSALDYSKTFTVLHSKNIPAAGVPTTVGRIVLAANTAAGTAGVLNVNGPLVCSQLDVSGVGASAVVKNDDVLVYNTTIRNRGAVSLLSNASLRTIAVDSNATLDLGTGVSAATAIGPVTVSNGGVLSVTGNGATIKELTVQASGQALINAVAKLINCRVEPGGVLVQQADGQIQIVHDAALSGPDLLMLGQLRNESNSTGLTMTGGAQMQVKAGAVYTHTANGGVLPTGTWDPASTLEITGVVDASGFTNDAQTFGNVVWDTPDYGTSSTGSNVFYLNGSGSMQIAGKLTVRNTGLGRLQLTPATSSASSVVTQVSAYEQLGGQVCVARFGSTLTRTLSVTGDFTLGSGRFELSNSSSAGPGVLKVAGTLQLSGGTLVLSGGATNGTADLSGNLVLDAGSDLRREVTGGIGLVNFVGTQPQYFSRASGTSISGAVDFQVMSGATLDVGSAVLDGEGDFTLNAGATLRIGHSQGIAAKTPVGTAYTGNVQVSGTRSFSSGGIYWYNGATSQITGSGLPTSLASAGELVIDNSGGPVTLSRATSLAGTLRLRRGRLLTSSFLLTLQPAAAWTNASDASYVDGPLARQTNSATQVYTFPVGANGRLKVGGVQPSISSSATFRMLAYTNIAPNATTLAPGSGLFTVSRREYWELTRTAGTANAYVRLYYTLPYSDIQETPAGQQALRIAALVGGQWTNYGQASLPNTTDRYLDAGQALALTTGTGTFVTFGSSSPVNPLPVSLVDFRAKVVGKDVQITWRTAQEVNCAGFEVQASVNGVDYRVLDYYNGQGSVGVPTNYAHLDVNAFLHGVPVRYYRLRQLDFDGTFTISPVVAVAAPTGKTELLQLWPVPAIDWVNIKLTANPQSGVKVRVLDAQGKVCRVQQFSSAEVPDVVRIPINQLHRGLYFVQVETELSRVQVRFLKE
ncbi:T9SS type A sorting domain-containing protein [Hymenobacter sp. 15J16-1T3B]|uniref:T9SS type A sorting domain-containing protein n=1 Tax=Hymenobacter sp. 15J16-1T3B TaxID=2886941 RepID=UPI001D1073D9|nr:T9SS type A sorting domain-containing protein [Hymenobacter sp. 15J16-1T3B]MCC3159122.1 T9SS type A sorting domain-containing protein [Hymenobacter sp. 15J16-1T3B]